MYAKLSSIILMLIIMHQPLLLNGLKQSFEDLEWQYFSITDEEITYLNSWAVQIKGSIDIANVVAEKYGFVNRGKIGNLDNVYHFYLPNGRSIYLERVSRILQNDTHTGNVLQQKRNIREKKSFSMPQDPLWSRQWSMYNNGKVTGATKSLDINVVPAWIQGVTGKNVIVTIVDDGIDHYHSDLKTNYDSYASFNYAEYKTDPRPSDLNNDNHGTINAGIVSMKRNSMCGIGVAYNARIGGIRLDFQSVSDIIEASALGHNNNYIQIYSNSWGPADNGYTIDGPGELLQETFENAVETGRNSHGNIYVWAAGNGGKNGDMCSCDGYASSMYTIAVGSVDESGRQAMYDENCPAKMAVTYSFNSKSYYSGSNNQHQVPSVNTSNRCTSEFTGTSASASLTTGVIALVLQVNSSLSWRDIQYLIVYTSTPSKLQGGNWTNTGAGLRVSPHFGFGTIDAEAMIMRARYWKTVPERTSCFIRPASRSAYVYYDSSFTTTFELFSSDCSIVYTEHVVIRATMTIIIDDHYEFIDYYSEDYVYENPFIVFFKGPRRGAISMQLKSPHGTPSRLLEKRPHDFVNYNGFDNWPFMSVNHWGENPAGYWYLSISFDAEGGHLEVSNISMSIYGTEEIPEAIKFVPNSCNSSCERGCSYNTSSVYCDGCQSLRMADSLQCVSTCPNEYCSIAGYCVDTCPISSNTKQQAVAATLGTVFGITVIALIAISAVGALFWYRKWKYQKINSGFTRF